MKNMILALMFVYSGAVLAADNPDWAYPVTPPPPQLDASSCCRRIRTSPSCAIRIRAS